MSAPEPARTYRHYGLDTPQTAAKDEASDLRQGHPDEGLWLGLSEALLEGGLTHPGIDHDDDGTELELDAVCGEGDAEEGDDIDTRLDLLGASASDDRKALLAEMKADRETAKEERLANLESKAPPGAKEKVQNARNKGKPDSSGGSSGGGSTGGGKPNDKGKPTATSGGSSSSGGGSSNSGGGGGKPDDKGKPDK